MYSEFVADKRRRFKATELQKEAAPNFPTNVVLHVLDKLVDDDFIKRSTQKVKNIINIPFVDTNIILFELSRLGIESFKGTAESELQDLVSSLKSSSPGIGVASPTTEPKDPEAGSKADSSTETDGSLIGASGELFTLGTSQLAPAADRYVSRSDNQEAWDKAVDALDNVISEVDKTNDFGDLSAAEVEHAKEILRTGRKLFDYAKVRLEALTTSLLPTLNWLKTHLSGMAVGIASGVAAMAIGKLLGLL